MGLTAIALLDDLGDQVLCSVADRLVARHSGLPTESSKLLNR